MVAKGHIWTEQQNKSRSVHCCLTKNGLNWERMTEEEQIKKYTEFTANEVRFCKCGCGGSRKVRAGSNWGYFLGHVSTNLLGDRGKVWNKGLSAKNDERVRRNTDAMNNAPKHRTWRKINRPEQKLQTCFLDVLFYKEYRWAGDGSFIINGCWPDFVDCNSQKKIIELFGGYWHADPAVYKPTDIVHHSLTAREIWANDNKRIKEFLTFGYSTLVVWERELTDPNKLKERLIKFHRSKNGD